MRAGTDVFLIGVTDTDVLGAFAASAAQIAAAPTAMPADVVILQAERSRDLQTIAAAHALTAIGGHLWVLWPKGRLDMRREDVGRAGRDAGLREVRLACVSARFQAIEFGAVR